jgi:hypothetical protein
VTTTTQFNRETVDIDRKTFWQTFDDGDETWPV